MRLRHRHKTKDEAEAFFLDGMTKAMRNLCEQTHSAFPVTIYYAFKQSESRGDSGIASTGWATFLDAVIQAGFGISGTWPVRTELSNRMLSMGTNALWPPASCLVCRPRPADAPIGDATRVRGGAPGRVPERTDEAPAQPTSPPSTLAQASIGPGMAVFTCYSEVLNADGSKMSVGDALALINATLDEVLAEQEGDFDPDSRWALTWFEQHGLRRRASTASPSNSPRRRTPASTASSRAGIIESRRGAVRILQTGRNSIPTGTRPRTRGSPSGR